VSEPDSFALAVSKPRSFTRVAIIGSFFAAAALMIQSANFNTQHSTHAQRSVLPRLMNEASPVVPSAFDEESTMGPAQLLGRWDAIITEASQRFHVPKAWIRAVMRQESGGRTMLGDGVPMVSRAGAVGLMQVLPATYGEMAAQYRLGDNPFEPRDNIMAGAAYLRWLQHKYGYPAMFAAYNAGPGRLEDHLKGARLPAETRAYIGNIAKTLNLPTGKSGLDLVKLTRPDGVVVKIDPGQVVAVRAALPGEYADSVKAVLILGKHKQQAIQEDPASVTAAIRATGKTI
jgi:soluble lytic murein transglycosylase-like protein